MTLNELASWSTIIQTVFVVISLIFIWRQLRQNTDLAKAANVQALVEHSSSFNSMLIQDPEIARLWYSFGKNLEDPLDIQRYRELSVQWLIFHENIYYQFKKGLLDRRIYDSWREDLKFFVHEHNLDYATKDFNAFFPGEFGKHILELKKENFNESFPAEIKLPQKKRRKGI